jgi:hypothetical protein
MRPNKPSKLDRRHPEAARDAMDDIKQNAGRYAHANRDRALGEADRTGRHFDEDAAQAPDEGSAASTEHEAD